MDAERRTPGIFLKEKHPRHRETIIVKRQKSERKKGGGNAFLNYSGFSHSTAHDRLD
jgi:hypothetical protein